MPHSKQLPLHFNWASVNLLLRHFSGQKTSTRSNKIKRTKKPLKACWATKAKAPRLSWKCSHLSKAVWRNLNSWLEEDGEGAWHERRQTRHRSPHFPRSIAPLREPEPWDTSRQLEPFPRRKVYPKKTPVAVQEGHCERRGCYGSLGGSQTPAQPSVSTAFGGDCIIQLPAPLASAPRSPSMEQGWVSSTEGCGIHARSSQCAKPPPIPEMTSLGSSVMFPVLLLYFPHV